VEHEREPTPIQYEFTVDEAYLRMVVGVSVRRVFANPLQIAMIVGSVALCAVGWLMIAARMTFGLAVLGVGLYLVFALTLGLYLRYRRVLRAATPLGTTHGFGVGASGLTGTGLGETTFTSFARVRWIAAESNQIVIEYHDGTRGYFPAEFLPHTVITQINARAAAAAGAEPVAVPPNRSVPVQYEFDIDDAYIRGAIKAEHVRHFRRPATIVKVAALVSVFVIGLVFISLGDRIWALACIPAIYGIYLTTAGTMDAYRRAMPTITPIGSRFGIGFYPTTVNRRSATSTQQWGYAALGGVVRIAGLVRVDYRDDSRFYVPGHLMDDHEVSRVRSLIESAAPGRS
jgi:hypothetical protein